MERLGRRHCLRPRSQRFFFFLIFFFPHKRKPENSTKKWSSAMAASREGGGGLVPVIDPHNDTFVGPGEAASPKGLENQASFPSPTKKATLRDTAQVQLRLHDAATAAKYPDNFIRTSKYNLLTFIPLNLFHQFQKIGNFYFLMDCVIALIPGITPLSPVNSILPLAFVLSVAMVKDGYEDFKRHREDDRANSIEATVVRRTVQKRTSSSSEEGVERLKVPSRELRVGDVVYVTNGEEIRADLLLLSASGQESQAFIETCNLDGETNLKGRKALERTWHVTSDEHVGNLNLEVMTSEPSPQLLHWQGVCVFDGHEEHAVGIHSFLYRSSILKNTEWAYGLVLYAGVDTKMFRNLAEKPPKFSSLDVKLNKLIIAILIVKAVCLIVMGSMAVVFNRDHEMDWYLNWHLTVGHQWGAQGGETFGVRFLSYFNLMTYLIPISLFVTIELCKVSQALLMLFDQQMMVFDEQRNQWIGCKPNTSNLNEQLSQVKFIFSDKTGTLTQNVMKFAQGLTWSGLSIINDTGKEDVAVPSAAAATSSSQPAGKGSNVVGPETSSSPMNVPISSASPVRQLQRVPAVDAASTIRNPELLEYYRALALCNTIQPFVDPKRPDRLKYDGASPDEVALVQAAANAGVTLTKRALRSMVLEVRLPALQRGSTEGAHVPRPSSVALPGPHKAMSPPDSDADDVANGGSSHGRSQVKATKGTEQLPSHPHGYYEEEKDEIVWEEHYDILSTLEFTPDRKMMSLVVRRRFDLESPTSAAIAAQASPSNALLREQSSVSVLAAGAPIGSDRAIKKSASGIWHRHSGPIVIYTKGADSFIMPRMVGGSASRPVSAGEVRVDNGCRGGDDATRIGTAESGGGRNPPAVVVPPGYIASPPQKGSRGSHGTDQVVVETSTSTTSTTSVPTRRPMDTHTVTSLSSMAQLGLRTLVVCSRSVSQDEFDEWSVAFQEAGKSLVDRAAKVDVVCLELEKHLNLIGCTAIEDKLQDEVPETLRFLLQAGIVIWMLTGDKRETAVTIAATSALMDPQLDNVLHIDIGALDKDSQEASDLVQRQLLDVQRAIETAETVVSKMRWSEGGGGGHHAPPTKKRTTFVIDGVALQIATSRHASLFIDIAQTVSSAVCCRLTPKQKADVVGMFQQLTGATALAIGDGANDVPMIQEGRVGIGIIGLEGAQAALAADYAIPRFKHLKRLLVVHGRFSLLRNSLCVTMSFFKNVCLAFTQVQFSFYSGWSATTLVDGWIMTFYNTLFLASTPFLCGCLEKDVTEEAAMTMPELYAPLRDGLYFDVKTLARWFLQGIGYSLFLFFATLPTMIRGDLGQGGAHNAGLLGHGTLIVSILVFLSLAKMALHVRYWHVLAFVGIGLSIAIYLLFLIFYALDPSSNFYYVAMLLMGDVKYWLYLALFAIGALASFDLSVLAMQKRFFPTIRDIRERTFMAGH